MNTNSIKCKITICGETETGKTCLINRLIDDYFEDSNETTLVATTKSTTFELSEEEVQINFSIFDTAGQEKFRSVNRIFFQDADIVILVYSIDNKKSFEEIQHYWLNNIRNYGKKDPSIFYTLLTL